MKKILLSMFAFAVSLTAVNAQNVGVTPKSSVSLERNYINLMLPNKAPINKAANLADNQALVGYSTTDEYGEYGYGFKLDIDVTPAVQITAAMLKPYVGMKVVGVRFALSETCKVNNVCLFPISGNNVENAAFEHAVADSISPIGWSQIMLNEDEYWTITETDALVGYTYKNVSGNYPMATTGTGEPNGLGFMVYGALGENGAEGWYTMGGDYGNLCIQLIVEGNFPEWGVAPSSFGTAYTEINKEVEVTVPCITTGKGQITNVSYTITDKGTTSAEQTVTLKTPVSSVGKSFTFPAKVKGDSKANIRKVTVNVTKINGNANSSATNSAVGEVKTVGEIVKKNVAVEELTGTQCGYCPRGWVGMERMREAYGDKFVGLAIHQFNSTDPMYLAFANYANVGFTSAPQAMLNRNGKTLDPLYGTGNSILDDCAKEMAVPADIKVDVKGNFDDISRSTVTANATLTSIMDGSDFTVAFALIADSLSGTTTAWKQSNYYSSYSAASAGGDELLEKFCKGGEWGQSSVAGLKFNDVVIASSYVSSTNKAAAVGVLNNGDSKTISYTMNMPTKATLLEAIQKTGYRNIFVAAMVFDKNGVIVNSTKSRVVLDATGINDLNTTTDAKEVARYTIDGKRISAPVKGVNIVKMSDGTTRKVVIK